ncbi:hypothetical protein SynWH8101_1336 [Synechococcus sp. WH 8101]|uniref:hypothetical protein n=1 Tax=Synechococcus sp. WH 8101 TaxID=59932 RepID=UPI001023EDC6|nr:hypothetical protein [Synechococcus sp. WH 8101]QBE68922.1 hypothetical protein SynWH8101_1336 [Synechococcus sp. WH 8101]QNI45151.1 putative conserved membrane protein [Synechococcus sp. WH 8101]
MPGRTNAAALAKRYDLLQMLDLVTDYTPFILGMVVFSVVITAAVTYVLAQPTDLPSLKQKG